VDYEAYARALFGNVRVVETTIPADGRGVVLVKWPVNLVGKCKRKIWYRAGRRGWNVLPATALIDESSGWEEYDACLVVERWCCDSYRVAAVKKDDMLVLFWSPGSDVQPARAVVDLLNAVKLLLW